MKLSWAVWGLLAQGVYFYSQDIALADDCTKGDALACYSQALIKLQAGKDEFMNASKDIGSLKKDIDGLHSEITVLRKENADLKAALGTAVDRIDSIKITVFPKYFDVPPASASGGVVDCPDPGAGLHAAAVASGVYLNEPDERNASFVRWYTWPKSPTEFGYFMINGAGTGMGHPPGHFAAYIGCLSSK
jgi:hypothetical protein